MHVWLEPLAGSLSYCHVVLVRHRHAECFAAQPTSRASEDKKQLAQLFVKCTQQDVQMNNLLSRARTLACVPH